MGFLGELGLASSGMNSFQVNGDANPAKPFPGSRPRFAAALYRTAITEKLDAGLSLQRISQDLVEEYGYGASYE